MVHRIELAEQADRFASTLAHSVSNLLDRDVELQVAVSGEIFRRQLSVAVARDCPSEAVRVLRSMGFTVSDPVAGVPDDLRDRLRAL